MENSNDFIRSPASLIAYLKSKKINPSETGLGEIAKHPFPILIPKYYVDLIDWKNPDDPLRKMVMTCNLENTIKSHELEDPIGDKSHSPVPGLVHRYPDRALLMFINICAVHCRFCFRKNMLGKNTANLEKSINYIKTHKEIWEVILSGGDPFMFTDHFMKNIMEKLRSISHLKIIRFHTRTPVVYPKRVSLDFVKLLAIAKRCIVVIHINHPQEITKEFVETVKKMQDSGVMLLSQTVLLRGVNDSATVLEKLFRGLVESGVKPYYLHHLDLTRGTDHFRISVAKGKEIVQKLRGNVSGVCLPEYVIDTPGGFGKIPVFWFSHVSKEEYQATNFEGKRIFYQDVD